jgi:hypothetical protein
MKRDWAGAFIAPTQRSLIVSRCFIRLFAAKAAYQLSINHVVGALVPRSAPISET